MTTRRPRIAGAALVLVTSALGLAGGLAAPATGRADTSQASAVAPSDGGHPSTPPSAAVPVYAYFYQWFTPSSWDRAKVDYPLAGRYSSDDAHVLRAQVQQAKAAGIDGFLTSWKHSDTLDRRLGLLIRIAASEGLDVGVVYQSLDFSRHPLPISTVRRDLLHLVDTWGGALRSRFYGRPLIIWTGTDQYLTGDVHSVRAALGDRALLLASSHSVEGYRRVAGLVDGLAYYWSSADPRSSMTPTKLTELSDEVHAHGGLWLAPAAPGYDGRLLGGTRVVGRDEGKTLVRSLDNAFASRPDGVGLISWNEWSENTYIEPGERYGERELADLTSYLAGQGRSVASDGATTTPPLEEAAGWTGARAALALGLLALGAVPGLSILGRRRRGRRPSKHSHRRDANRRSEDGRVLQLARGQARGRLGQRQLPPLRDGADPHLRRPDGPGRPRPRR